MEDPEAQLERALIEEFLLSHGHSPHEVWRCRRISDGSCSRRHRSMPPGGSPRSGARAHYVHDLHHQE